MFQEIKAGRLGRLGICDRASWIWTRGQRSTPSTPGTTLSASGGDRYGRPLAPSARLRFSGRFTLGAGGNLPREIPSFPAGLRSVPATSQPRLSVDSWEILTQGSNPTTLDEARLQIDAMLRPDWRAVTADDFGRSFAATCPISRASSACPVIGHRTPKHSPGRPGYVGIIVIPDRTAELTASTQQLCDILATTPDTTLAAVVRDGGGQDCRLVMEHDTHGETGEPKRRASRRRFQRRMAGGSLPIPGYAGASSATGTAGLWDVVTGSPAKYLGTHASPARFSTTGRWIVTMHKDGARLRDAGDGATIHRYRPAVRARIVLRSVPAIRRFWQRTATGRIMDSGRRSGAARCTCGRPGKPGVAEKPGRNELRRTASPPRCLQQGRHVCGGRDDRWPCAGLATAAGPCQSARRQAAGRHRARLPRPGALPVARPGRHAGRHAQRRRHHGLWSARTGTLLADLSLAPRSTCLRSAETAGGWPPPRCRSYGPHLGRG